MTNKFFCQHGVHVLAIWLHVLAKVVHIDHFCKFLRACVLAKRSRWYIVLKTIRFAILDQSQSHIKKTHNMYYV